MRIAVVLSGTIRFHHKSLSTISFLKQQGHEVDVYIHTWRNVEDTKAQSWSSHYTPIEPTDELIRQYNPIEVRYDNWLEMKEVFVAKVEQWRKECGLTTFTHYGMPGMWYSLMRSFENVRHYEYALIMRLRFDCELLDNIVGNIKPGWNIPEAVDFGGLSDQVAWYLNDNYSKGVVGNDLEAYFNLYEHMPDLFRMGAEYSPEHLLKKSFDYHCVTPHRPLFKYTIHDD